MAEIFKECDDGKLTMEEVDLILKSVGLDFKFLNDAANGYIAFDLKNTTRNFADALVSELNNLGEDNWFLGDENEEYVYVY